MAVVVLFTVLTSCGDSADPKKAINGLNENISFYEALSLYCEEMVKEIAEQDESKVEYEITIQKGWAASSKLDEDDLGDEEKAITFSLDITSKSDYETRKYNAKFFMRFDEGRNMVIPWGVYISNNGDVEEGGSWEAGEFVLDVYENLEEED